jgi:septal ring factor EnvC (AmiA/AmiB activator)
MQEALAAAQAQLAELQKQLAEGEVVRRGLDAELARLRRQLAEEQSERGALEEQLAQHLEESEDFMAQVGYAMPAIVDTLYCHTQGMWLLCIFKLGDQGDCCLLQCLQPSILQGFLHQQQFCTGLLVLLPQDAVAAFEAKYNRLKTRYRELTEAHRVEVDGLHDEIAGLQERLVDLEAAAAQLEAAR